VDLSLWRFDMITEVDKGDIFWDSTEGTLPWFYMTVYVYTYINVAFGTHLRGGALRLNTQKKWLGNPRYLSTEAI